MLLTLSCGKGRLLQLLRVDFTERRSTLWIKLILTAQSRFVAVCSCRCGWGETARVTSRMRMMKPVELLLWRAFGWVKAPGGHARIKTGRKYASTWLNAQSCCRVHGGLIKLMCYSPPVRTVSVWVFKYRKKMVGCHIDSKKKQIVCRENTHSA